MSTPAGRPDAARRTGPAATDVGSWRGFLGRAEFVLPCAIVVVLGLVAALDEKHNYLNDPAASAVDILRQTALLGIFAIGAAVVIISGGIDLSSGSVIAFSGTTCASIMLVLEPEAMQNATPLGRTTILAALVGTLTVGALIGSMHAWLITRVGLPPFVATLATLVGLRSFGRAVVERLTESILGDKSTQIQIYDQSFRYLATSVWIPVVLFLLFAVAVWVFLSLTVTGRHLHALGGNEQAARLSGVRTDRLKWLAYSMAAVLSSIAGILYIGDQSVADPQTLGRGYELNAIAAAVVGGCSLQGGVGTIPGVVMGALFLRVIVDGVAKLIKTGADVYEGLIVGAVVVLAVALTQFRQAARRGAALFSGGLGVAAILGLVLFSGMLTWVLAESETVSGGQTGTVAGIVVLALLSAIALFERRRAR